MKTWNAFQIGMSNGAYSGHPVSFYTPGGSRVRGTLTRSDHPRGDNTDLTVDGHRYVVPNDTLVEVY